MKNIKKKRLIALFSVIGIAIIACIIFVGLNSDRLGKHYTLDDYQQNEFVGVASEYTKLFIDVESTDVEVFSTDNEQIKISYFNMDKDYYTVSTASGEIKMTYTNQLEANFFASIFGVSLPKKKITIELPKSTNLDMEYVIKYGDATFSNINNNKEIEIVTDSVNVALSDIKSSKINIDTKYGELNMVKVQSGTIKTNTDSVTVKFDKMNSNSVDMTAKYGSLSGSFIGNYNDYTVKGNVKDGKNNLSNFKGTGSKTINIEADSASAHISFAE